MIYRVRLADAAEADLRNIFETISERASPTIARGYVNRILRYIGGFDVFPQRGRVRNNIRRGLRIVGFERRVGIAFVVEDDEVVVLRILYGGQRFESGDAG